MDALQLLGTLQERGATLQMDGDALRVSPSRVLDNDLRAAIRCHKLELLELLLLESASTRNAATRAANVGRDFVAAFHRVRGSPPSHCAKFTNEEMNEYSIVVAALDCRIDPSAIPANILSLISQH